MDILIKKQKTIGQELGQKLTNYKGDPKDRRTKKNSEERLHKLQQIWNEFIANDVELQLMDHLENTSYRTNKYFELVEKIHDEIKDELQSRISEPNEPNQTPATRVIPIENHGANSANRILFTNNTDAKTELENKYLLNYNAVIFSVKQIRKNFEKLNLKMMIERKIVRLEQTWDEYKETEGKIIVREIIVPNFEQDRVQLEDYVESCLHDMYEKLESLEISPNESHPINLQIKPMEIPSFTGEYQHWLNFHDLFNNAIIQNKSLNCAEKMQYLKIATKGKAADAIAHLKITDENFSAAWTILNERFENTRLQVLSYVDKLLDLPEINNENAENLIKFHDTVKDCLQALKNQKIDTNNWDTILIPILARKMDFELRKDYENSIKYPKELQKIEDLLKFIKIKFEILGIIKTK